MIRCAAMRQRWSRRLLIVTGLASICTWAGSLSCSSSDGPDAVDRGAQLFQSRELSSTDANIYTCATCHDSASGQQSNQQSASAASATIKPGALLAGVTRRPSFWGGMESDLLDAVDDCRQFFMYDRDALGRNDAKAVALYAFLVSLEPGNADPVAFTVPSNIADVPRGDAGRGQSLFSNACGGCHGQMHSGVGRLSSVAPILPEDTITSHTGYDADTLRLIFIEKARHGGFYGYSGVMPPFSEEVLNDSALGDILEAFGVTGMPTATDSGTP